MFENPNNLFIAWNADGGLSVWRDGDNSNGPDELMDAHNFDPMVWEALFGILPFYTDCEVCGLVDAEEHDDAACRNSQDNYVNGFNN